MSGAGASVIVPTLDAERLARLLASLAGGEHQTIVIDNGSDDGAVEAACAEHDAVDVIRMPVNLGFSRAVNLGAARADGDILVLLNDDCVCDEGFVERIAAPIDRSAGIAMAAGVMRDWAHPALIDSAGMELDRTLLVFDYLNGEPLERLDGGVPDPVGPSAAAAAIDRRAFLESGGFDEAIFAYWEDVDLVLRLRAAGYRCVLAPDALGTHEHSATLGSGSARKNYLMGFGRGYVLRKWKVISPSRAPAVLVREATLCAGQAVFDRNLSGVRGRFDGFRAAQATHPHPREGLEAKGSIWRRARRRASLARRPAGSDDPARVLVVFHLADTSGPSRSLEAELGWLATQGPLDVVLPGRGTVEAALPEGANVLVRDYEALTTPGRWPLGPLKQLGSFVKQVRGFRELIAERRPDLIVAVTSMVPAASVAARLERAPLLIYCGELFDRGYGAGPVRALAGRQLARLTGRLATGLIACSEVVARQFEQAAPETIEVVYPPHDIRYRDGDAAAFRAAYGIAPDAPLLVSVGYLTEGRGQDVIVRALPAILERRPGAHYVVVGDPFPRPQDLAYRQYLVGLIAQLKLQHSVTLAGHIEDVADVYAAADVVVNPARFNEPFGRVPFEAAIAGRPSVVTRVGAIPELLSDRSSALIVPPDDPEALAAAVVEVLSDPDLARDLAAAAREIVATRLTPAHSLAGFQRAVAATLGYSRPDEVKSRIS